MTPAASERSQERQQFLSSFASRSSGRVGLEQGDREGCQRHNSRPGPGQGPSGGRGKTAASKAVAGASAPVQPQALGVQANRSRTTRGPLSSWTNSRSTTSRGGSARNAVARFVGGLPPQLAEAAPSKSTAKRAKPRAAELSGGSRPLRAWLLSCQLLQAACRCAARSGAIGPWSVAPGGQLPQAQAAQLQRQVALVRPEPGPVPPFRGQPPVSPAPPSTRSGPPGVDSVVMGPGFASSRRFSSPSAKPSSAARRIPPQQAPQRNPREDGLRHSHTWPLAGP